MNLSNEIGSRLTGGRYSVFTQNAIIIPSTPEDKAYEKTVVYEGLNRSRNLEIGYKYPKLEVGNNAIVIHSGSATVKIKRKDRWL